MKKIFALVISLTMVVAFSGATFAAEEKKAAEPAKAAEKVMEHKGVITAVDAKANTFTMKTEGGEITCGITADTKITSGGAAKTLADVKVGDNVECKCVKKGDKFVSKALEIKAAVKK